MTLGGWMLMIASNASVIGLTAFCLYRVLKKPSAAEHQPPTL